MLKPAAAPPAAAVTAPDAVREFLAKVEAGKGKPSDKVGPCCARSEPTVPGGTNETHTHIYIVIYSYM